MEEGLPIALRRTPRRQQNRGGSPETVTSSRRTAHGKQQRPTTASKTPRGRSTARHGINQAANPASKAQSKHDADDSTITVLDFDTPVKTNTSPSGLKRKRQRQPTRTREASSKRPCQDDGVTGASGVEDEDETIYILPLRQVLDGRIRRRIKRNGLSEEMNTICYEKRARRKKTEQELQRLRDEMAGKDAEIERLRGFDSSATVFGSEGCDVSRIHELEKRLTQLKQELSHTSPTMLEPASYDDSGFDMSDGLWDHNSDDGGMMDNVVDDNEFGDSSVVEMQGNTTPEHPGRAWASDTSSLRVSGPALISPPSTSPTKPSSPATERHQRHRIFPSSSMMKRSAPTSDAALQTYTATSDVAAQAGIPDLEKESMGKEISALRSELASLSHTLQVQETEMREKLSEDKQNCDDMDLGLQMDIVMQDLSDKTATLSELQSSLSLLLSSPYIEDEEDIIVQMTMLEELNETMRSVRLELECLSPGEVLPDGADEILDLAIYRLQDLSRQLREKDELLREKDSMIRHQDDIIKDGDREIDERNRQIRERDARISALELDVERLSGNMADLEALARRLEDSEAKLRGELEEEREASSQKDDALRDTEAKLADVLAQAASLRSQLADKDLQLIHRDGKLAGLRGEVERLGGALAEAHSQLRAARGDASRDRVAAQNAVVAMRAQLLQALSVGEGFLGVPSSSAPTPEYEPAAIPKEEPGLELGRRSTSASSIEAAGVIEGKGADPGIDLTTLPAVPTGELVTEEPWKGGDRVGLLE